MGYSITERGRYRNTQARPATKFLAIYNLLEFTDEIKKAPLSDEEDTSLPYPEKFEYKPLPEKYLQQYDRIEKRDFKEYKIDKTERNSYYYL